MDDQQAIAQRDYDAALKSIREQAVGRAGSTNEIKYGEAYQKLVMAGLAPQLKRKYTQPKKFR